MFEPRRIAIWNTAFLGDAVLTLPLVRLVHVLFPRAEIDFYVRAGLESLFVAQPELHRVYGVDKKHTTLRTFVRQGHVLRVRKYDLWLGGHTSFRSTLMAFLSRAAVRIGYCNGASRLGYTACVERRFGELDEIERVLQLLHPLRNDVGARWPMDLDLDTWVGNADWHWPKLVLPQDVLHRAADLMPMGEPVLGVHPGSVWATKRWPMASFAELMRKAAEHGMRVCVFGGTDEVDLARSAVRLAGLEGASCLSDFSGQLSLTELAAVLQRLSVYVGNDSGPLHLAWSQHVPLVALFGPTVRELGFFPRGDKAVVLEVPQSVLPCRPCGLHGAKTCPQTHHRCMHDLSPKQVWQQVQRFV